MDVNIEGRNDEDTEDSDVAQLQKYRQCFCPRRVLTSEITTIEISCDQKDDTYFIDEDATILASFGNHSAVLRITWMKKTEKGDQIIDTMLPKHTGSTCSNEVEKPMLIIKNCDELDIGTYFLMALCNRCISIESNKIDLKVVKGPPRVTLNPVPLALQYERVEIKATIRCFPKCHNVIWMKDDQCIDTTDPKYDGSIDNCQFPVLCIKEVKKEDDGLYKVIARNELGEDERSEDLEVIKETQMIFISGPVVVTPLKTITFHAYLPGQGIDNAQWWKIKNQSKKKLKVDNSKYCICQMKDKIRFEITLADKDDSAAYQFTWKTMKSNRIYVHINDSRMFSSSKQVNCLRLFELQSVSADAMRLVLDHMPNLLQDKIKRYLKAPRKSDEEKEFVLRLKRSKINSSKDMDISMMYMLIRKLWSEKEPQNGWGKDPTENDVDRADDIERIRRYRNYICHSDASGMDIKTFNFSCLDLFRAIDRLSVYDPKLIQSSCDIMNRVYTNGKDLKKLIEKFENEKKLNLAPINEDPSSPSSSQDEVRDEDPTLRTSPSPANKETHARAQTTERPMQYADRRVSDSSDSEIHARAQTTGRPMRYVDGRLSYNLDSETYYRAERPETPMQYADRRFYENADSETYYRSERPETPMLYADRRFSDNPDSVISESLYNTRITTRSGEIEHIRFHEVCDPEIMMHDNYTTAKQSNPYGDGMCFMNRPMELEEIIHIYGHSYPNAFFRKSRPNIKIGLTNTDPEEIREAVHQKEYYVGGLEEIKCFSDDTTDFFHIYICLCSNATLSICVHGFPEYIYKNQEISPFNSIWLVIEPYGIDLIRILNK